MSVNISRKRIYIILKNNIRLKIYHAENTLLCTMNNTSVRKRKFYEKVLKMKTILKIYNRLLIHPCV